MLTYYMYAGMIRNFVSKGERHRYTRQAADRCTQGPTLEMGASFVISGTACVAKFLTPATAAEECLLVMDWREECDGDSSDQVQ